MPVIAINSTASIVPILVNQKDPDTKIEQMADAAYMTATAAEAAGDDGDTFVFTEAGSWQFIGTNKTITLLSTRWTCNDDVRPSGKDYGDGVLFDHPYDIITGAATGTTIFENFARRPNSVSGAFDNTAAGNVIISGMVIKNNGNTVSILGRDADDILVENCKCILGNGVEVNSCFVWNFSAGDRAVRCNNNTIVVTAQTTTPSYVFRGQSGSQRVECQGNVAVVATGANIPTSFYTNCVAPTAHPEGYNGSGSTDAPGTVTYDNLTPGDVLKGGTVGDLDMHYPSRTAMLNYPSADVESEMYCPLDRDNQSRAGNWYMGADYVQPDHIQLIDDALNSVFSGSTPTLRTSYDRWEHDGNAAGGIEAQRRPTVAIKNDASTRLGVNAEPRFVTIVESPVLYVGMGDGSESQEITNQTFEPDKTGIIYEYRYGVDREMREATPFMSAFGGNQKNLYSIDTFPTGEGEKNWLSTAPSSFRLTSSNDDAQVARKTPASGNEDKIYDQQELAELIGAYKSHPESSKLREIRYISLDVLNGVIYATGSTTEQRRRLPSAGYQGSNYTEAATEDSALFTINKTTGAATLVAEYNGSFWDSALIQSIHLLVHNESNSTLYGIMPAGSHQSFLDAAEASGNAHVGTIVSINKSTAAITEVGALYWVSGTSGYDSIQIKNVTWDQIDSRCLIVMRTDDGAPTPTVGHSIYEINLTTPAFSSELHVFDSVSYADSDGIRSGLNIRAIVGRGDSGQLYALASKGIGEMQNPKRFLYAIDTGTDGNGTEIGLVRQTTIDSLVEDGGTFYGVDADAHEFVEIHTAFDQSGVFQRDMGALVVDVFDTGATDEVVYTRLNIDNSRAMDYHDLMIVTLEASEVGELLQIEFGSAVSKIDGRTPVLAEPGRQPDLQVQKVNFRTVDKQVDVYININGSTFGNPTRDEMRYIGFRVKDASKPFTFKVNRIQLMKLNPDVTPSIVPPDTYLEDNKQFVQFTTLDRRKCRWFVQIRAILLTEIPPISPRMKDAVSHTDHDVAVINHPHRRLRGGRMVTPHLNDSTLGLLNPGYSQSPAKISGAYISDGYGVDPASEPIRDPLLFFGSGGAVVSASPPL